MAILVWAYCRCERRVLWGAFVSCRWLMRRVADLLEFMMRLTQRIADTNKSRVDKWGL